MVEEDHVHLLLYEDLEEELRLSREAYLADE